MSLLYRNATGNEKPVAGLNGLSGELVYGASTTRSGTVSVTLPSTTSYTYVRITFDEPMPDANYIVNVSDHTQLCTGYVNNVSKEGFVLNVFTERSDIEGHIAEFKYTAIKLFAVEELKDLENAVSDVKKVIPSSATASNQVLTRADVPNNNVNIDVNSSADTQGYYKIFDGSYSIGSTREVHITGSLHLDASSATIATAHTPIDITVRLSVSGASFTGYVDNLPSGFDVIAFGNGSTKYGIYLLAKTAWSKARLVVTPHTTGSGEVGVINNPTCETSISDSVQVAFSSSMKKYVDETELNSKINIQTWAEEDVDYATSIPGLTITSTNPNRLPYHTLPNDVSNYGTLIAFGGSNYKTEIYISVTGTMLFWASNPSKWIRVTSVEV